MGFGALVMVGGKAKSGGQRQECARTSLRADTASAGVARRFVSDVLANRGMESLVDTAALLTSEVVTDPLVYAGEDLELEVSFPPSGVRVEVSHAGASDPVRAENRIGPVAVPGRELLESLAERWGSNAAAGGRSVWFELPVPRRRKHW